MTKYTILPKALYKECVYIDKEGARIISGQGYVKEEERMKKK